VQHVLGVFWIIDALLALQPTNFTSKLVSGTILGNAENQPEPILGSIVHVAHLIGPYPIELNVAIIVVQLGIGVALLMQRNAKAVLAFSVVWALGVWWIGEGLGGTFSGEATLLVGAPGPALLYALLALVAWPRHQPGASTTVAGAGALGERITRDAWAFLWVGGSLLRVAPFWFAPVYALRADLQLGLNEEPHWIFNLNEALTRAAARAGLPLVIAMALLEATIGIGVFTRWRREFLTVGMVLGAVYWCVGQQFAGLFSGAATDIGTGPLIILLAWTLWPISSARSGARGHHRRKSARTQERIIGGASLGHRRWRLLSGVERAHMQQARDITLSSADRL
jgi:hypothetical protein